MPATDYQYDASGMNPANLIVQEVHPLADRGMFTLHGPFFEKGLLVEGFDGASWTELKPYMDYTYSPVFSGVASSTGQEVFSYLVYIGDLSTYQSYRLTYQAVGQFEDLLLLGKVTELTQSERSLKEPWLNISNTFTVYPQVRDPILFQGNSLERLNTAFARVSTAIANAKNCSTYPIERRMAALETGAGITPPTSVAPYTGIFHNDPETYTNLSTLFGITVVAPTLENGGKTMGITLGANSPQLDFGLHEGFEIPFNVEAPYIQTYDGFVAIEFLIELPQLEVVPTNGTVIGVTLGFTRGGDAVGVIIRYNATNGEWDILANGERASIVSQVPQTSANIVMAIYINPKAGQIGLVLNGIDLGFVANSSLMAISSFFVQSGVTVINPLDVGKEIKFTVRTNASEIVSTIPVAHKTYDEDTEPLAVPYLAVEGPRIAGSTVMHTITGSTQLPISENDGKKISFTVNSEADNIIQLGPVYGEYLIIAGGNPAVYGAGPEVVIPTVKSTSGIVGMELKIDMSQLVPNPGSITDRMVRMEFNFTDASASAEWYIDVLKDSLDYVIERPNNGAPIAQSNNAATGILHIGAYYDTATGDITTIVPGAVNETVSGTPITGMTLTGSIRLIEANVGNNDGKVLSVEVVTSSNDFTLTFPPGTIGLDEDYLL